MASEFRMVYPAHIRNKEKKQAALEKRVPSVFNSEDPFPSGPSFSKKDIRERAVKLAEKKGWKVGFAERVVRREIARLKVNTYKIPTGAFYGTYFTIKGYTIKYKMISVPFGETMLWRYRAYECDCRAGRNGHRCWHQDYTDYMLDNSTIPQKYGKFHRPSLLRIRKREKGIKG